ncbi:MAG TPA: hypothetical protein VGD65_18880 [Chryseosolibacter sp.]
MSQPDFKPERISRTASFIVNGEIEDVFPLFGPIREKEWAEGWNPEIIFSRSDLVEEHMIFRTSAPTDEKFYTWVITHYDPSQHLVEYTVSTANRIWFIQVLCERQVNETKATVTYTYTGLNTKGNELNRAALGKMYATDLKDWQQAINHYLDTGKMLSSKP